MDSRPSDKSVRSFWPRLWTWGVLVGLLLIMIVAIGMFEASRRVPEWYCPALVLPEEHQQIRDELQRLLTRFNNNMQRNRRFTFLVDAQQINRWLGAPQAIDQQWANLTDGSFADPMVQLIDDEIILSATVKRSVFYGVLQARVRTYIRDDRVFLTIKQVRLGSLPLPTSWMTNQINRRLGLVWAELTEAAVDFIPGRGWSLPVHLHYSSSGYDVHIEKMVVSPGQLLLEIQPVRRVKER